MGPRIADSIFMYTAIGTYPDGREAALAFETLDAAMQKIRDWAEADELEADPNSWVGGVRGEVMFIRYALTTPAAASAIPSNPQPRPAANAKPFQLRLAE